MDQAEFLVAVHRAPLIASVQADPGTPLDTPETIVRLAKASVEQGVRILRLQGAQNIRAVKKALPEALVIGLIKRQYEDSSVYITPTNLEVQEVIDAGAEVVALDGTERGRPGGEQFRDLVDQIHGAGRLALADIDDLGSATHAASFGADFLSTTLSGYTDGSTPRGPDLELLRALVSAHLVRKSKMSKQAHVTSPFVLAEGRFSQHWQIEAALRIGADGVVVGGALNDPIKQTKALWPAKVDGSVGAVDIGGTWLRFAVVTFNPQANCLRHVEKIPLPEDGAERLSWIKSCVAKYDVQFLGVSSGGTLDPQTGEVWEAKGTIPGHVGTIFDAEAFGIPTLALNDGLASAWGHANLPEFAGRRVATIACGTGIGCGFVSEGKIWMGPRGEYTRVNDLFAADGKTIEDLSGGAAKRHLVDVSAGIREAVRIIESVYFPDDIVICGAVGLLPQLSELRLQLSLKESRFGEDAGLFGAAALAQYPGWKDRLT